MADKIQKLLAKLSKQELATVEFLLQNIVAGNYDQLDIKQLKGHTNIFRAKKARMRVIYSVSDDNQIKVLLIARRNEKTYKDF